MIKTMETFALLLAISPVFHYLSFLTVCTLAVCGFSFWFVRRVRHRKRWRYNVGGHVEPGFEQVAEVFRANVASGQDQGSAFSVYHRGRLVVDLWGGYADFDALRFRTEDSVSMVYSATKMVTALVMATLVHRGQLSYDALVSKYWPEFGRNGKKGITIATLLSHQSGLVAIEEKHRLALTRDDPKKLGQLLVNQKPFWTPGTGQGYQVLTFGLYADQLVRRIDDKKRSLAEYFRAEIAEPYDIDFYIGLPRHLHHRSCRETRADFGLMYQLRTTLPVGLIYISRVIYSLVTYRNFFLKYLIGNPTDWKPRRLNDPSYRELPCGASHGFATARGLAKLMGILGNGGEQAGKRLVSEEVIEKLGTPLADGFDRVVLRDITYGPGTIIEDVPLHSGEKAKIFGHWGAGGQMAYTDRKHELGWAYLTNYCNILHGFIVDHRYSSLTQAMYDCVQRLDQE